MEYSLPTVWFALASFLCVVGIVKLVLSGIFFYGISRELFPLLAETKEQLQDIGDLAANTVGRASDTMDIVEVRVAQTMGQVAQGGASVKQQAVGLGMTLAGLYLATKLAGMLRPRWRRR